MKTFENQTFEGERSLFKTNEAKILNCTFQNGESPLKESHHLDIYNSTFSYKYPLWYGSYFLVKDCTFNLMARSGIWYSTNSEFTNNHFISPKLFRHSSQIEIYDCVFDNAEETFWNCNNIIIKNTKFKNSKELFLNSDVMNVENVTIEGDYAFMNAKNVKLINSTINGNYCFDGGENIYINNCTLNSKDALWNVKNATIENSTIIGEYLAWNSKNIKFINCRLESHQGFCYIDNLNVENCSFEKSDLTFEYCTNINASINSEIDSIKNPISGIIRCKKVKEFIFNDKNLSKDYVKIEEEK